MVAYCRRGESRFAPSNVSAPLIWIAPATAAPQSGNFQIVISLAELAYLQASRASAMHTLPSASTNLASLASRLASYARGNISTPITSALIASHDISWVIDLGASAHMAGTPSILTSYHLGSSIPNVHIADGCPCPVCGSRPPELLPPYHYIMSFTSLDFPQTFYPSVL